MRGQKGIAFIMALIWLLVGSLLIVPALGYTFAGMKSAGIYEDALEELYAADSSVDDALWQLLTQLMGTFNPGSPQPVMYDFQLGAAHIPVTISIPSVPPSQNYGTGNIHNLMVEVVPRWLETPPGGGPSIFEYIMRIDMQNYNLTNFKYTLPKGLTHVIGASYFRGPEGNATLAWDAEVNLTTHQVKDKAGLWQNMSLSNYTVVYAWPPTPYNPTTSYLYLKTEADGRQTVEFLPYFGSPSGRRILIHSNKVTGTAPWGISYLAPAVFTGGFGTITIPKTAAIGVAMYIINMVVSGTAYRVVVAYDSTTDSFKIVSYQVL